MAFFRAKTSENLEEYRDITDDVQESDFVPYACHYSPDTIITKNGELLKTIKIVGFNYESLGAEDLDLRDTVRRAISESLDSNAFALWLHTIRRKSNLDQPAQFPNGFSRHVHESWKQKNGWDRKFTNELYITIVHEGQSASPLNPKELLRALWPPKDRREREAYLAEASRKLTAAVDAMVTILKPFGAKLLSAVEREDGFYSEPCEFLGKIINLTDDEMPLPDLDLAQYLTTQEITFGFNAMEVRSHQGRRRFGSILTLKEYKEMAPRVIDRFMQLPVEFIVTQCVDFINSGEALNDYTYQKMLSSISGDKELAALSGLDDVLSHQGRATDYGEQQLSVFLLADDLKSLERYVNRAVATLSNLGIIAVREDIRFEECYWAQLPGNFEFVKRLKSINVRRIAGFANLNNFPAGRAAGNLWGDAVTLFYTAAKTPYFFNFHIENNGHTLITGPQGSGKATLLHFLLSEAQRYHPRLVIFDCQRESEALIGTIGGQYVSLSARGASNGVMLQPLQMKDSEMNRRFLTVWVGSLLGLNEENWTDDDVGHITSAVAALYHLTSQERRLGRLQQLLSESSPDLAEKLSPWIGSGRYAALFDHAEDGLNFSSEPLGFDLTALRDDTPDALLPVFSYLHHRATLALDGTPAILVFKEAWGLFNNVFYARRVGSWLDALVKRNALAIFTLSELSGIAELPMSVAIAQRIATGLFLPDDMPDEAYRDIFGLTEQEVNYLGLMRSADRQFLLKRGSDTIVSELDLAGMDDIIAVFDGDSRSRENETPSATPGLSWEVA